MIRVLLPLLTLLAFHPTSALASEESDTLAVRACLQNWGKKQPFGERSHPEFTTLSAKAKVLGFGHDLEDSVVTSQPRLILVKASANILSSRKIKLLNPNGWYCLKGEVNVLGKAVIKLHCRASLASSKNGAAILGSADQEGTVTVLGASRVERVGCE